MYFRACTLCEAICGLKITVENGAILGAQAGIPTGKTIRGGDVVWGTPARPIERFKEQYGWISRLPDLASRIRKLEDDRKR